MPLLLLPVLLVPLPLELLLVEPDPELVLPEPLLLPPVLPVPLPLELLLVEPDPELVLTEPLLLPVLPVPLLVVLVLDGDPWLVPAPPLAPQAVRVSAMAATSSPLRTNDVFIT